MIDLKQTCRELMQNERGSASSALRTIVILGVTIAALPFLIKALFPYLADFLDEFFDKLTDMLFTG